MKNDHLTTVYNAGIWDELLLMSVFYQEKVQFLMSALSVVHVSFTMSCISFSQKMHLKD